MYHIKCIISVCVIGCLISCASFGTRVKVISPESLSSLKSIIIWPVVAVTMTGKIDEKFPKLIEYALNNDPAFRRSSETLSRIVESHLSQELKSCRLISIIDADSISTLISIQDSSFSRFSNTEWWNYKDLITADALIITKVSFGRESGGVNTYVTLSLYNKNTRKIVIESKFNTKWGKNYLLPQSFEKTLPDAIHGAVNALVKTIRKHNTIDGSNSTSSIN